MRDRARLANMCLFMVRDEERQRQGQPSAAEVDKLAETIAGPQPQGIATGQPGMPPPPPPEVLMDTETTAEAEAEKSQGDDLMQGDGASTDKDMDAETEGT